MADETKYIKGLQIKAGHISPGLAAANRAAMDKREAELSQAFNEKVEKIRAFFTSETAAIKKQLPGAAAWYAGKLKILSIDDVLDLDIMVDRIQAIIKTAPAGSIDFFNLHDKRETADFLDGIFYRARQRREEQRIFWDNDPALPPPKRNRSDSGKMLLLFDYLTKAAMIGSFNHELGEPESIVNAGSFEVLATGKNKRITQDLFASSISPCLFDAPVSIQDWPNYCAICSIYHDGTREFTPEMVYRKKNGLQPSANVPAEGRKEIIESIERIRDLKINCNVLDFYKLRGLDDAPGVINEQALIISVIRSRDPEEKDARLDNPDDPDAGIKIRYIFKAAPVLYVHAQRIEQLKTHNKDWHDVRQVNGDKLGRRINSNTQRDALRFWLMLHVINRIYGSFDNPNIIYDYFLAICGINYKNRDIRMDARKYIIDVLNYWQFRGYIKGFAEYKNGRKIAGVTLTVEKKQKADKK